MALSRLGSYGLIWLLMAAVAALLWRRPQIFAWVLLADAVADLSAGVLKRLFDTERPPLRYPDPKPLLHVPASGAFPSGHAATSFACAAVLAWLTPLRPLPLFLVAAAIACSRVYVGVHYPLDVIGGAMLGLAVAYALRSLVASRALRRRARGQTG